MAQIDRITQDPAGWAASHASRDARDRGHDL